LEKPPEPTFSSAYFNTPPPPLPSQLPVSGPASVEAARTESAVYVTQETGGSSWDFSTVKNNQVSQQIPAMTGSDSAWPTHTDMSWAHQTNGDLIINSQVLFMRFCSNFAQFIANDDVQMTDAIETDRSLMDHNLAYQMDPHDNDPNAMKT
jgi:hypothetical protein